ncbi:S9 family peptidase [Spirochaeta africana]|uniref:Dipeptidyl aminopeptidase/acylaminoacyl peptidase n=1 Tax=Spirochaeta africana (strain ATCC 700263 / DSM 8902 / Z-7692) TaxID=889378 RepID=H9UHK2_SPIAZ|nr:S9 family peptidase [Spirochaeta africana]AFG36995.1 dipeptidyl aminopeptidase/acylaminoacyl peptidase [Spirochaeta africana DSM 8902]
MKPGIIRQVPLLLVILLFGSCQTLTYLRMNDTHRALLNLPTANHFSLSPDGSQAAWLDFWRGTMNLYILDLTQEGAEPRRITSHRENSIHRFSWISPDWLRITQDTRGDERFFHTILSTDGEEVGSSGLFDEVTLTDFILPDTPDEILVLAGRGTRPHVYRLNLETGERTRVVTNPGSISSFRVDQHGVVRFGVTRHGADTTIRFRADEDEPFRVLLRIGLGDVWEPLGYDPERAIIYAATNIGLDRTSLVEFDPHTAGVVQILADHPVVDLDRQFMPAGWDAPALARYEHEQPGTLMLHDRLGGFADALASRFPEMPSRVQQVLHTGDVLFTVYDGITTYGVYVYRESADEIVRVFDAGAGIDPALFSSQHAISYQSRDGRTIHGYLSLPPGLTREQAVNLPTVMHVHGGPWVRDTWGMNAYNQLFGARGYAVLQVNYRGSSGYGREHLDAGNKQWGRAMQDDITDGVHWLIEQGIADPDAVAIYGASYGGYAALAGAVFTPELYAAVISEVGPSNLFTMFLDSSITQGPTGTYGREIWHHRVGHPNRDAELFREISPVFHADRVQAPVMIVHGENDPRVPLSQSLDMVEALREQGKHVEYHGRADEGHGFANYNNILDLFTRIDRFLTRHMPASP